MDDALGVRWLGDGLVEVGVHIADVSYFVRQVRGWQRWSKSQVVRLDVFGLIEVRAHIAGSHTHTPSAVPHSQKLLFFPIM